MGEQGERKHVHGGPSGQSGIESQILFIYVNKEKPLYCIRNRSENWNDKNKNLFLPSNQQIFKKSKTFPFFTSEVSNTI